MSSSEPNDTPNRWGRVFMGPDVSRESTIDKILNAQERELWNRSTEIEYLKRVRDKATAEAQGILEKAQAKDAAVRAAVQEWAENVKVHMDALYAEAMREREQAQELHAQAQAIFSRAHEEGVQAGLNAAEQAIAQHEYARDAATASVLRRIQEQCGVIFEAWRQELAALSRETVEAATGWVLREEHAAVLEHVLVQSAQAMEQRLALRAKVNPEDAELVRSLFAKVQEQLGVERWEVVADPAIESGGLILENNAGRVDALLATRRSVVEEVLSRMAVPHSAVDEAAMAAVAAPDPQLDVLPQPEPPAPEEPQPQMMETEAPVEETPVDIGSAPGEEPNTLLDDVGLETPSPDPDGPVETVAEPLLEEESSPSVPTPGEQPFPDVQAASLEEPAQPSPEQRAMDMASAAMDKALSDTDSLPPDVAAYILDAVSEDAAKAKPVETEAPQDADAEMKADLDMDLDMDVSAPGPVAIGELPEGLPELEADPSVELLGAEVVEGDALPESKAIASDIEDESVTIGSQG